MKFIILGKYTKQGTDGWLDNPAETRRAMISSLSDKRDKKNITDLLEGIDFINKLRPVKFEWATREGLSAKDGKIRAGFIAQELQEAQTGSEYLDLVMDENPDKLEAKQGKLIPVLVKAIQELSAKVKELESKSD